MISRRGFLGRMAMALAASACFGRFEFRGGGRPSLESGLPRPTAVAVEPGAWKFVEGPWLRQEYRNPEIDV